MSTDNLLASIKSAIESGNLEEARILLRVALKEPTVEIYCLASQVALNEQQRQSFLAKAKNLKASLEITDRKPPEKKTPQNLPNREKPKEHTQEITENFGGKDEQHQENKNKRLYFVGILALTGLALVLFGFYSFSSKNMHENRKNQQEHEVSQNPTNDISNPTPSESPRLPHIEMIKIPAGEFIMGSNEDGKDEAPMHTVYLETFYIDKFEVTEIQYRMCVEAGVCKPPSKAIQLDENIPVTFVTWYDAVDFCKWLGRRLPTEAEWEKAARGTDSRRYPWGNEISCDYVNYLECPGTNELLPVGSYPMGASPYGVLDMLGNVGEWVHDWYDENYYSLAEYKNPVGSTSGVEKSVRGADFVAQKKYYRVSFRKHTKPYSSAHDRGFRCAADSYP